MKLMKLTQILKLNWSINRMIKLTGSHIWYVGKTVNDICQRC